VERVEANTIVPAAIDAPGFWSSRADHEKKH
jgi:hypothetical protein